MDDQKIYNWTDVEDEDGRHSREDRLSVAVLLVSGILGACYVATQIADGWGWLS